MAYFLIPGQTGVSLLLAINANLSESRTNYPAFESSKSGYEFALKTGSNLYTKYLESGIHLGWFHNEMTSTKVAPEISTWGPDGKRILTEALFLEVTPASFRFTPTVVLGPILQVRFGADTSFSPYAEKYNSSAQMFGGAQFLYGDIEEQAMRFGFNFLTSMGLSGRAVFIYGLTVAYNHPVWKLDAPVLQKPILKEDKIPQTPDKYQNNNMNNNSGTPPSDNGGSYNYTTPPPENSAPTTVYPPN